MKNNAILDRVKEKGESFIKYTLLYTNTDPCQQPSPASLPDRQEARLIKSLPQIETSHAYLSRNRISMANV